METRLKSLIQDQVSQLVVKSLIFLFALLVLKAGGGGLTPLLFFLVIACLISIQGFSGFLRYSYLFIAILFLNIFGVKYFDGGYFAFFSLISLGIIFIFLALVRGILFSNLRWHYILTIFSLLPIYYLFFDYSLGILSGVIIIFLWILFLFSENFKFINTVKSSYLYSSILGIIIAEVALIVRLLFSNPLFSFYFLTVFTIFMGYVFRGCLNKLPNKKSLVLDLSIIIILLLSFLISGSLH